MKIVALFVCLVLAACSNGESPRELNVAMDAAIKKGDGVSLQESSSYGALGILNGNVYCSAVLISPDLVLTAAHCFDSVWPELVGFVFTNKITGDIEKVPLELVDKVIAHKDFGADSSGYTKNDIAVVKIQRKMTTGFRPVALLDNRFALQPEGKLTLMGWGPEKNEDSPESLRKGEATIKATRFQEIVFKKARKGSPCFGDSGGPAYISTAKGPLLAGIIRGPEVGYDDCNHETVATLVTDYKQFILESAVKLKATPPKFISP